jgi:dolichol-phosphate mannosyltransferase
MATQQPTPQTDQKPVRISIVIPVHNECAYLESLVCGITNAFELKYHEQMELILVDDGSSDDSLSRLRHLKRQYRALRVLSLQNCEGQSAALWVGFQNAKGEIIATLDGDGQYDPIDLVRIVEHVENGCDFSIGHRCDRADGIAKIWFSSVANTLRRLLMGSAIPDSGCSLRAFRRELLPDLFAFHGLHRFIPTLFESVHRTIVVVEVAHFPRKHGSSHYGFLSRGIIGVADGLMLWWLSKRRILVQVRNLEELA